RRLALEGLAVSRGDVMPMPAVAPVEPAVGAEVRSMDVGGVAGEAELGDQLGAQVRLAAFLCIEEFPDAGRRRGVDGALIPEGALREAEPVGEDMAGAEDAALVRGIEDDDAVGELLEQVRRLEVSPGAVGEVEPAFVVEAAEHGMLDERSGRDAFDGE